MPQKSKARIFQALRIYINNETGELEKGLNDAIEMLKPGGKICVISYHSIEDRMVKTIFRDKATGCICPPGIPLCRCGHVPEIDLITRKPPETIRTGNSGKSPVKKCSSSGSGKKELK